jgi:cell division protein FtsW (lipid II flippase)
VTFFYLPSAVAGYLFAQLVNATGWAGAAVVQLMFFPLVGAILMIFVRIPERTVGTPRATRTATTS